MVTSPGNSLYNFPRQDLTEKEKKEYHGSVEKWAEDTIRAIDQIVFYRLSFGNSEKKYSKKRMEENIDLIRHGIFDTSDFRRLINPYGEEESFKTPLSLEHYPIIQPKIEILKGEEISRPFNFSVINCTDDSINTFQEKKGKEITEILISTVAELLNAENPEQEQEVAQEMQEQLKKLERYYNFTYSDHLESAANSLIKYELHNQNLIDKFHRNFETFLCTGSEIYAMEIVNDEVNVRIVDPRFFDYDDFTFENYIEDSLWCREVELITSAEVHMRYYNDLTKEDVEKIESQKGLLYLYPELNINYSAVTESSSAINTSLVRVAHFEWESLKLIYIVTKFDENGFEIKEIVDNKYEPEEGEKVEKKWVNERWEGIRINLDTFIRLRPIPNQYKAINSLTKTRSKYVGIKAGFSMVDKLKKYQYLYNIVMHHLKLAMARNKGKAFVMDYAQIPKSKGWSAEKWLHMVDNFGIAMINSLEDSNGSTTSFNQFQTVDRSQGDLIAQLIQQLDFIENAMSDISGITPQREGQVSASETYGGIERSVTQSAAITESLFYLHNQIKKRVLQRLLDFFKANYKPNKKYAMILNDQSRTVFEIPEDFDMGEYGVFITDSGDESKMINEILQLLQVSLQQKEITIDKYIEGRAKRSLSEMAKILKESVEEQQQRQSQQGQEQSKLEQQKIQAQKENLDLEHKYKLEIEQLKSDTAKEVARINAEARVTSFRDDVNPDANNNGVLDVVEKEKVALARKKLDFEIASKNRELDIKENDVQGKKELEALKIEGQKQKLNAEIEKINAENQSNIIKTQTNFNQT